jgi:hypothetical protein
MSFIVDAGFIACLERQSTSVFAVICPGLAGSICITEILIASLGI